MVAAVKFTKKTLPQKEGLGEKLAKKRIALGLDPKDIEKAIYYYQRFLNTQKSSKMKFTSEYIEKVAKRLEFLKTNPPK